MADRTSSPSSLRSWTVAGAVIEVDDGVLLVRNLRRNGTSDWTPPGGVVEVGEGESVLDGLTREVAEETGLVVTEWDGPLYEITAEAPGMGWLMRVEVWRAASHHGELVVGDDPDGIVVEAAFVAPSTCDDHLVGAHPWVREPLVGWLTERWDAPRSFRYHVAGEGMADVVVTRIEEA